MRKMWCQVLIATRYKVLLVIVMVACAYSASQGQEVNMNQAAIVKYLEYELDNGYLLPEDTVYVDPDLSYEPILLSEVGKVHLKWICSMCDIQSPLSISEVSSNNLVVNLTRTRDSLGRDLKFPVYKFSPLTPTEINELFLMTCVRYDLGETHSQVIIMSYRRKRIQFEGILVGSVIFN